MRTRKSVQRTAMLAQPSGQVHLLGVRNGDPERAPGRECSQQGPPGRECPQQGPGTEVPRASGPFTHARWADVQLPVGQEGYPQPSLGQWQLEPMDAKATQPHPSSHRLHVLILSTGCLTGLATPSEQLSGKDDSLRQGGASQAGRTSTSARPVSFGIV